MLFLAALCLILPPTPTVAAGQSTEIEVDQNIDSFPDTWQGVWKGTCRTHRSDGKGYTFAMELHILPAERKDRRTWKLIYGEGERRQVRAYELILRDAAKGDFVIDEKNGITIDSRLFGSQFCSQYSVNDSLLTVTYALVGEEIVFQLLSSRLSEPALSGGNGDIPEVKTYAVDTVQEAVLKRQ